MESYKILAENECTTLEGVDDAEEFQAVKAAFDTIGIDDESQLQVRCPCFIRATKACQPLEKGWLCLLPPAVFSMSGL